MRRTGVAATLLLSLILGFAMLCEAAVNPAIDSQVQVFTNAWDNDDGSDTGMATIFAGDASMLDPFGNLESGKSAISKHLIDQHSPGPLGVFYQSAFKVVSKQERPLQNKSYPYFTLQEWEVDMINLKRPDGSFRPPVRIHVTVVWSRINANAPWLVESATCALPARLADLP